MRKGVKDSGKLEEKKESEVREKDVMVVEKERNKRKRIERDGKE